MAEYTTESGQTIFDLSVQLYGNASNAVKLLSDNPTLQGFGKLIPGGTVVTYTPPLGFTVSTFLSNKKKTANTGTGNPLQGSGFDEGFTINGFY